MEKIIAFLAALLLLAGCAQNKINQVEPVIEATVVENIWHPEAYIPGKTKVVYKGTINASKTENWRHLREADSYEVIVFQHTFEYENRSREVRDGVMRFYFRPDLQRLYHWEWADNRTPLWEQ